MKLGVHKKGYNCAMNLQINDISSMKHEICTLIVWRHAYVFLESLRAKAFKFVIQTLLHFRTKNSMR